MPAGETGRANEEARWLEGEPRQPEPCPTCGGITDDPAGGPCSLCWARVDDEGVSDV